MTASSKEPAKVMTEAGANACTDVTGFGLIGHAFEMAKASNVTFELTADSVPLLPDVLALIRRRHAHTRDKNNRVYVGDTVSMADNISSEMQSALYDPQTAGGLLISLPSSSADEFLRRVPYSKQIGIVNVKGSHLINVR
jgi:selenide,water dikinase